MAKYAIIDLEELGTKLNQEKERLQKKLEKFNTDLENCSLDENDSWENPYEWELCGIAFVSMLIHEQLSKQTIS